MDYNLSDDQKFQFMQNILRKYEHSFFLEAVRPSVKTYKEAAKLHEKEYNSVVRQTRIKTIEWAPR